MHRTEEGTKNHKTSPFLLVASSFPLEKSKPSNPSNYKMPCAALHNSFLNHPTILNPTKKTNHLSAPPKPRFNTPPSQASGARRSPWRPRPWANPWRSRGRPGRPPCPPLQRAKAQRPSAVGRRICSCVFLRQLLKAIKTIPGACCLT